MAESTRNVQTTYDCLGCGGTFQRSMAGGPVPKRCKPCSRAFQDRTRRDARASRVNRDPRPCADCGELFTPASRGVVPGSCSRCSQRAQTRKQRQRPWHLAYLERTRAERNAYQREYLRDDHRRQIHSEAVRDWAARNRHKRTEHSARRRATTRGASVTPVDRLAVYERDGWTCQLCNRPIDASSKWPDRMSPSLDHRTPLARGGAHAVENLQAAHLRCNLQKHTKDAVSA